MEEKTYTNKELAQDYFNVVAQDVGDLRAYNLQRRRIAELNIDLTSFYLEHRSFAELKVNGIGHKTKKILELILEMGTEKARRFIQEENINKTRESRFIATSRKFPTDAPPSWDNTVKRYEED